MKSLPQALLCLVLALSCSGASAATNLLNITYATVGGKALRLDLHLPTSTRHPPLVIYVHGGAWSAGDKTQYPVFLVERGYAVASVDFRSTDEAPFPANTHDIKAAIRFLRARAESYGYDGQHIALSGASSGAHLAALVGVTADDNAMEGTLGDYPGTSSTVQGIVSWFGASNLTTILAQSTPFGLGVREPALRKLLGDAPDKAPDLARQASPVFHISKDDPPALLLHGDQDRQMPINQLHELQGAYEAAGLTVETLILHGVGHDSGPFFTGAPSEVVVAFLRRTIG
ncbi:MAG: alpha/beta hydrolase [Proteobacteria bacterium]|nr:alpha/beta hydrolase [Pseudomonadota bacterium]